MNNEITNNDSDEYEPLLNDDNIHIIDEERVIYMEELESSINNSLENIIPISITSQNIINYIFLLPRDQQEILKKIFERHEGEIKK